MPNINRWYPKHMVTEFDQNHYDFEWNEDYTMFRALELPYWDDASYITYQGDRDD